MFGSKISGFQYRLSVSSSLEYLRALLVQSRHGDVITARGHDTDGDVEKFLPTLYRLLISDAQGRGDYDKMSHSIYRFNSSPLSGLGGKHTGISMDRLRKIFEQSKRDFNLDTDLVVHSGFHKFVG